MGEWRRKTQVSEGRWQGESQLRVLVAAEPEGGSEQLSGPVIICKAKLLPWSLVPCTTVMRCSEVKVDRTH